MAEELLPNDDVTKISTVSGVKEIIWRDDWHVHQLCIVGECVVFTTCTKYVDIFKNIIFVKSGATFHLNRPLTMTDQYTQCWSIYTVHCAWTSLKETNVKSLYQMWFYEEVQQ